MDYDRQAGVFAGETDRATPVTEAFIGARALFPPFPQQKRLEARGGIIERTIDNSAAYLQGWLEQLRDDKTLVVQAAAQAQKTADFILGNS